jgi:hypothetical protein
MAIKLAASVRRYTNFHGALKRASFRHQSIVKSRLSPASPKIARKPSGNATGFNKYARALHLAHFWLKPNFQSKIAAHTCLLRFARVKVPGSRQSAGDPTAVVSPTLFRKP